MSSTLEFILKSYQKNFNNLLLFDLNKENTIEMDFSSRNKNLSKIDLSNEYSFCGYIESELKKHGAIAGVGGYGEQRVVYDRSSVFAGDEPRTIHLGLDIWTKAGTTILAPLAGLIHSFQVNPVSGDYGPTIILEHSLDEYKFYTLYGHLSTGSLENLKVGQAFQKGDVIAHLGEYYENVHWPPHLHFQIIKDLEGKKGDYPGVAKPSEKSQYLENCPDPNLILGLDWL